MLSMKNWKTLAVEAESKLSVGVNDVTLVRWYEFILDTFFSKKYKPTMKTKTTRASKELYICKFSQQMIGLYKTSINFA